ncbi:hypothetical protein Poli38472_012540 [Pythium oligandrum]|uniref:TRP C-terminal domain-containing protein n=1 Tax=Pythium oligandrum TaxID=41045 RepID=A0A8K1FHT2_PYTOL|nr:hypothetical protein Poli38472_012540 [Pythium oligandrum]|eukprot:TMW61349.1 hypothetical protein Poli38472_012540 [Pythium oligandrum]
MRIVSSLLVAAAALATTVRADASTVELSGNAAVTTKDTSTISVSALSSVTSPLSQLTDSLKLTEPSTVAPSPSPSATTKTPSSTTSTPSSTKPSSTPASSTGSGEGESTATPYPTADGGSYAGSTATGVVGEPIKCAFRYSLPVASNLQAELQRAAESKKETTTSTTGSYTGSSTGTSGSLSDATGTTEPGTGSSTGTIPSAGDSSSTGTTPLPTSSTLAPKVTTRTPTTTTTSPSPSRTTTTRPSTGSTTGDVGRVLAEVSAGEPTTTTTDGAAGSTTGATEGSLSGSLGGTTVGDTTVDTTVVTGEFSCDATFYGAWSQLGLTCGGEELDVTKAVAQSQCLIYGGLQTLITDLKMCMSVCKFPKCENDAWDYTAEDGFTSEIYKNLNFVDLVQYSGLTKDVVSPAVSSVFSNLTFSTDRQCSYTDEDSFSACQCENFAAASGSTGTTTAPALQPFVDKGLGDSDHWPDGLAKSSVDKAGIAGAAIGGSAAAVSVAMGGVMSVAGTVMGSTGGVATGVSAGASLGLAMAAVDLCQFSVMINQMNLDATPRVLQEMGRRMAPAAFNFLPFGKEETNNSTQARRLTELLGSSGGNQTDGMERYAKIIGVKVDMVFYVAAAGVLALCLLPFVLWALLVMACGAFVKDFREFGRKWFDKAVGALMMVLIVSEYVIGVSATFQICYQIDNKDINASVYLAFLALVVFAVGTVVFGVYVVRRHEDELRDLGTKDHFEKPVHARYGPLYDEYKFEGRFFFAPKLLLALFCGMTTGMIWVKGIWQIVIMLTLHIAFLFYLEFKQPYPTQFVQRTSSFVIIIKISALLLSFFLIQSATSFNQSLPVDLREGVGFAIIGLQVLVLVCLMVRQVYIFYRTWKIRQMGPQEKEVESFYPIGNINYGNKNDNNDNGQYHPQNQFQNPQPTPMQHEYAQQTPDRFKLQNETGIRPTPMGRGLHNPSSQHVEMADATPHAPFRRHNEVEL